MKKLLGGLSLMCLIVVGISVLILKAQEAGYDDEEFNFDDISKMDINEEELQRWLDELESEQGQESMMSMDNEYDPMDQTMSGSMDMDEMNSMNMRRAPNLPAETFDEDEMMMPDMMDEQFEDDQERFQE